MNTTRRLRAFVAGTVAALALAVGSTPAFAEPATAPATPDQLGAKQTLTVTAPEGQLTDKNLVAIQLATYSSAELTTDNTQSPATAISSYEVATVGIAENASAGEKAIKNAVTAALEDNSVLGATKYEGLSNYYKLNPMRYVAEKFVRSEGDLSADDPLFAGDLRNFLTTLAKQDAISGATGAAFTVTHEKDKDDVATASDLTPGIYLILDKTTTDSKVVASIPMMTGTGIGSGADAVTLLRNTMVQDKDGNRFLELGKAVYKPTEPEFTKKVDKPTAAINDTVTFTLTTTVPNWTGYTKYQLSIKDEMSKGLTFDNSGDHPITVKIGDAKEPAKATDVPTADWKATVSDPTSDPDGKTEISIVFGPDAEANGASNLVKAGAKDGSIFKNNANLGKTIFVTYKATLNKDAVIDGGADGGNPNEATLTYSNNPSKVDETKTHKEEVKVYSGEFTLTKTDMDGTALAGATFTLKRITPADGELANSGDTGAVSFIKVADGQYRVATAAEVKAAEDAAKPAGTTAPAEGVQPAAAPAAAAVAPEVLKEVTVPESGSLKISGLQGTYELAEASAPKGYTSTKLLLPKVTIEVDPSNGKTTLLQGTAHDDAGKTMGLVTTTAGTADDAPATVTVKNAKSLLEMPKTGAAWLVLYLAAAVICGGAGSALLLSRRRIQRA